MQAKWRRWLKRRTDSTGLAHVFTNIFQNNSFGGRESISGPGSDLLQTSQIRSQLPDLFRRYGIASIVDAPCGDFFWMQHVDLAQIKYTGIDIVEPLIEANAERFSNERVRFRKMDITSNVVPRADLILCRDLLVHLTYGDAKRVLRNFKASRSRYLLTTTFPNHKNCKLSGIWRPINVEEPPYEFPKPLEFLNENCTEDDGQYSDKCLGLWTLDSLALICPEQ